MNSPSTKAEVSRGLPLPYGRQWLDEDDVQAVVDCLRGDWLTQGPAVDRFEKALGEATGARHAIAVSSGTAALHLAAIALGVGPGEVGVVPAITFAASANAIRYAGGTVSFADVDPTTALIDVDRLERQVRSLAEAGTPPRVIVPVDFAGQPADLPAIRRIADRFGARVLEDAAHSLGAAYRAHGATHRAGCGSHADAAILSFHPVKHITTGEGGAVLTNDAALAAHPGPANSRHPPRPAPAPAARRRPLVLRAGRTRLQLPHCRHAVQPGLVAIEEAQGFPGPVPGTGCPLHPEPLHIRPWPAYWYRCGNTPTEKTPGTST